MKKGIKTALAFILGIIFLGLGIFLSSYRMIALAKGWDIMFFEKTFGNLVGSLLIFPIGWFLTLIGMAILFVLFLKLIRRVTGIDFRKWYR